MLASSIVTKQSAEVDRGYLGVTKLLLGLGENGLTIMWLLVVLCDEDSPIPVELVIAVMKKKSL